MVDALETWLALGICLLALSYVAFVNRATQRYKGHFTLDLSVPETWNLFDISPGREIWMPGVQSVEWVDESRSEHLVRFVGGHEMRIRITRNEAPRLQETVSTYLWASAEQYGDLIHSRMELTDVGGRTRVALASIVERRHLATGFFRRLMYPLMISSLSRIVRSEIARRRLSGSLPAAPAAPEKPRRPVASLQVALAALAAMSFAYLFGPGLSLVVLATLFLHEYGHVFSMRRHGQDATFYFIPLLGGVAIGNRHFLSDAEAAEVLLMGPLGGILPGIGCLAVSALIGDLWWASAAFFVLAINLFNLLPSPPLDGGRVAQILIRPLGDSAWFVLSGLLILLGAAVGLYLGSKILLILFVLAALSWSATPKPLATIRPLTGRGTAIVALSYAGLVAAHLAALVISALMTSGQIFELLQLG